MASTYSELDTMDSDELNNHLKRASKDVIKWASINAGSKKIPPPQPVVTQPGEESYIPSDEERLQK